MSLARKLSFLAVAAALVANSASAAVYITEWAYQGSGGEFIELTNVGTSPVDFTGWSFDDDSQTAGTVPLASFGIVQPRESVLIADIDAATFRTRWNLAPTVKVLGGNTTNLSRGDEINIFSGTTLIDRLTYGDETFAGSIRTNVNSGNPNSLAALGENDVFQWSLSASGDVYGSYAATGGSLGNPGTFALVPEPAAVGLLMIGVAGLVGYRNRNH